MNAAWLIVALIVTIWALAVLTLSIGDALLRHRERQQLQTRDWAEKVEAMRRMVDREGDA
jgi:hypothetical protein